MIPTSNHPSQMNAHSSHSSLKGQGSSSVIRLSASTLHPAPTPNLIKPSLQHFSISRRPSTRQLTVFYLTMLLKGDSPLQPLGV